MEGEYVPINRAPSNSLVRIIKPGDDRLRDLGVMDGAVVKVLISTPCGPVLIQREDGSVIVLDVETASNTLVLITERLEPAKRGGRRRWRWGWKH